jgi:hypothetical protein
MEPGQYQTIELLNLCGLLSHNLFGCPFPPNGTGEQSLDFLHSLVVSEVNRKLVESIVVYSAVSFEGPCTHKARYLKVLEFTIDFNEVIH